MLASCKIGSQVDFFHRLFNRNPPEESGKSGQVAYVDIGIDQNERAGRFRPWRES